MGRGMATVPAPRPSGERFDSNGRNRGRTRRYPRVTRYMAGRRTARGLAASRRTGESSSHASRWSVTTRSASSQSSVAPTRARPQRGHSPSGCARSGRRSRSRLRPNTRRSHDRCMPTSYASRMPAKSPQGGHGVSDGEDIDVLVPPNDAECADSRVDQAREESTGRNFGNVTSGVGGG
jgi:hypothetical protein